MDKFLKQKAVFMIYLTISLMFTVYLMPNVFAQEETTKSCCERTISGDTCMYTDVENCDTAYNIANYQQCEDTAICKIGCCVSEEDGSCSMQTSKATCEAEGFTWYASPNCEIEQCTKGCCVLAGASCAYVSENKCEKIFQDYPELDFDFREAEDEKTCIDICRMEDRGCCVTEGGDSCLWTTRGVCGLQDGTGGEGFYQDVFCSAEDLPCDCVAEESGKHCLEGTDDIYWFDSCGNPEHKAEECNYAGEGTLCTEADEENEEAYCKSTDCLNTWDDPKNPESGGRRLNGEAWCSYDAKVGPTFDVVGSRHYRHMCINGEEIVEPCKDYREEICWQGTYNADNSRGTEISSAACRDNRWEDCTTECLTTGDSKEDSELLQKMQIDKKCCERSDLRDCVWVGEEDNGICMPLIAPGLKFWADDEESGETPTADATTECEKGKYEIKAHWGKKKFGEKEEDWDCKEHCFVYGDDYLVSRNEYCRSLGDCGAHYNYLGEFGDEGFYRTWEGDPEGDPKMFVEENMLGALTEKWDDPGDGLDVGEMEDKWGDMGSKDAQGWEGVIVGGVVGGVVVVVLAIAALAGTIPVAGWIVAAVLLIAAALTILFTWPETEDRKVTLNCFPWMPPLGGSRCSECDQPFKPCSEYRCRSLGGTCRFIPENEGTGKATCYDAAPNDVSNPKISWDEYVFQVISKREDVTASYPTEPMQQGHKVSKEVPAFSSVRFGILTDELSQCYLDTEFKDPMMFSDLSDPFPDTLFSLDHNITYNTLMPDTEYKFYVSCRDPVGNPKVDEYIAPYVIEITTDNAPDLEAPYIIATELPYAGKVPSYANDTIIMVYVDEPSEFTCRIDKENRDYDLMMQEMGCTRMPAESVLKEYHYCAAKFNVTEGPNTVYIRCRDNPVNSEPNTMTQSYAVTFVRTEPLVATDYGPSGDLYEKNITMFMNLEGGADNGIAICSYENEQIGYGVFGTTNVSNNENVFTDLPGGDYMFNISCSDFVNNHATAMINFSSKRDNEPPEIVDIYKSGYNIYIKLNEPSDCQYANASFTYGEGKFSAINAFTHTFVGQESYHIICEDSFGNLMPETILYISLPKIERVVQPGQLETPETVQSIGETPTDVQTIG